MVSLIVPSTEPSATTIVSASSVRYGRIRPPLSRPNCAANSAATCGISSSACSCLACARNRTSVKASGPTIAPMETGSDGSRICRGSNGGRNASTWLAPGSSSRSCAWVRMNPSMHTITGSETCSAIRYAWMCRSIASWLVSA